MRLLKFSEKKFYLSYPDAADFFLDDRRARNLTDETIVSYGQHLRYFQKFLLEVHPDLEVKEVGLEHVKQFIPWLGKRPNKKHPEQSLSTCTVRKAVISLKTFFKFLYEEKYMDDDFYLRIKAPRSQKKVIESLSAVQIKRLLDQPDRTKFDGYRDFVMIMIFCDCGLRLSEMLGIRLSDIDWDRGTFKALGKGNKERYVPVGKASMKALKKYITWRGDLPEEDRVFVNLCGRKLDPRRFQRRLAGFGKKADLGHVHPHLLRHSFAKNYILHGGDPFSLQMILGHTTLSMVKHYVTLAQQEVSFQYNKHSVIDNLNLSSTDRNRIFLDKRK